MSIEFKTVASLSPTDVAQVQLTVVGNTTHIVWQKENSSSEFVIQYANTSDGGASFSTVQRLSNLNKIASNPQIVANTDSQGIFVHVVWSENVNTADDFVIKYNSATAPNYTFNSGNVKTLSTRADSIAARFPQIASNGNDNVYVVWERGSGNSWEIEFNMSINYGLTFGTINNVGVGGTSASPSYPQIALRNNRAHVVWSKYNGTKQAIYYRKSNQNGIAFSSFPEIKLSNDSENANNPQIAINGDNVFVVWDRYNGAGGINRIQYNRSDDYGQNFNINDVIELSTLGENAQLPQIALNGDEAHVVWQGIPNLQTEYIIGYRSITIGTSPGNDNLGNAIALSAAGKDAKNPKIAVNANNLNVVWYREDGASKDRIQYRNSNDNGSNFNNVQTLSAGGNDAEDPQIALNGDDINMVWVRVDDTVNQKRVQYVRGGPTPTMAITSTTPGVSDGSTTSDASIALTFTALRATGDFAVGDITFSGGALSNFAGSGTTYTATFTPSAEGATTIDVAASTFTDANGFNNLAASQFNWTYSPAPYPVASACFLKDTIIKTDSGNVKIQDIKEEKHSINGKKVKALTKTLYAKKGDNIPPFLISIPKGALFKNSPDKETFVSPLHSVFYHGELMYAKDLVLMDKASPVNYNYKDHVYDILLDSHEKMVANNMIVETLDPESITGRFYRYFVINKKASSEEKALAKTILYEFNNFYWNECLNYPKINPEMKYDFDEAVYKKFLLTCKTSEKKKIFKSLV